MEASDVQDLFRQAVAEDDADAMRAGLERLLGIGGNGGLSPEREYALRHPGFVLDMPQSGERLRGRDTLRTMQQRFPGPVPKAELRRVTGARSVWIAEGDIDYGDARSQVVVIFELDEDGLIVRETRYYPAAFTPPAWRSDLAEAMA